MELRKYLVALIVSVGMVWTQAYSQSQNALDYIRFSGGYGVALGKNDFVTAASGFTSIVEARSGSLGNFSISFKTGFLYTHISQPDPIEWWDWAYWQIQYENWLESLLREGNYNYEIDPMERMELIPVLLSVNYNLPRFNERIRWSLSGGGGLFVFERKLSTNERWKKEFPDIDYVFEYEFINNAPGKTGTLFGIVLGMNAVYEVSRIFGVSFDAHYNYITSFINKRAMEDFPYTDAFQIQTGLVLFY